MQRKRGVKISSYKINCFVDLFRNKTLNHEENSQIYGARLKGDLLLSKNPHCINGGKISQEIASFFTLNKATKEQWGAALRGEKVSPKAMIAILEFLNLSLKDFLDKDDYELCSRHMNLRGCLIDGSTAYEKFEKKIRNQDLKITKDTESILKEALECNLSLEELKEIISSNYILNESLITRGMLLNEEENQSIKKHKDKE